MACTSPQWTLLISPSPPCPDLAPMASTLRSTRRPRLHLQTLSTTRSRRRNSPAAAADLSGDLRPDLDDNPEGIISGEWPENFSLLSYDDLRAYLETQIVADNKMKPSALLGEVMSTPVRAAKPDQRLEEIDHYFEEVSGLPVVDDDLRCIGVISKKDKARATDGLNSKVGEVMSSPATTLSPNKTVLEAAAVMLKKKIHRIPVLNEQGQVVGIVTRSDIFQALEALEVNQFPADNNLLQLSTLHATLNAQKSS